MTKSCKPSRGIYGISINGEIYYVGQSRRLEARRGEHLGALSKGVHSNKYLQRVYDKYGGAQVDVLEEVEEGQDLYPREAHWIRELNPPCNFVIPTADGWTFSEETRRKMSEKRLGVPQDPEHARKRLESSLKTRKSRELYSHYTEESRRRMSDSLRGVKQSDEHISRRVAKQTGVPLSEERKKKISQSVRKTTNTPEFRELASQRVKEGMKRSGASEKISKARKGKSSWNKGIPRTDEVKKALSEDWAKRPIVECPYCGKKYKLLNSHITKKHKGEPRYEN